MKRFTAQIRHSYDTILRMCRVQDDTFCFGRKMLMALAGLALGLIYRRKRKRWMKLVAILAAAFAAVNLAIPAAFFVWAMSF